MRQGCPEEYVSRAEIIGIDQHLGTRPHHNMHTCLFRLLLNPHKTQYIWLGTRVSGDST